MKPTCRSMLVVLAVVLAVSAVAASGASAFEFKWKVNGVEASGQEVSISGGSFEIEWRGSTLVKCTTAKGKGTVKAAGAGEASEITFTGCQTFKANCTVYSSGQPVGTVLATGIPTQLKKRKTSGGEEEVLADEFKENATTKRIVTLNFKSEVAGACSPLPAELAFKGEIAAEVKNLSGNVELLFPHPELLGNTFNAGETARLFGAFTESLVKGGTLTAS